MIVETISSVKEHIFINYKFILFVYINSSIIQMTTKPTKLLMIYIKMNLRIKIIHIQGKLSALITL